MGKYSETWGIAMIFLAIFQPRLMKPEDNVHYPSFTSIFWVCRYSVFTAATLTVYTELNSMVSAKDALKLVH